MVLLLLQLRGERLWDWGDLCRCRGLSYARLLSIHRAWRVLCDARLCRLQHGRRGAIRGLLQ